MFDSRDRPRSDYPEPPGFANDERILYECTGNRLLHLTKTLMTYTFRHPEPARTEHSVWPVFLPYQGCPNRCAFCAQHLQTGTVYEPLDLTLAALDKALAERFDSGGAPLEIGFYGGTFTALPGDWAERFLRLAAHYKEQGKITRIRCSTRPDAVTPAMLDHLRSLGLDMVELGVQSFDDGALSRARRGYDAATAREACHMIHESGLSLGIQLMAGLPGDREGLFLEDVMTAASLKPQAARIYPCLVMEGTGLCEMYRAGEFEPWDLERAKAEIGAALLLFWKHGVRVIRTGLAPEPAMQRGLVAGPWHEAFGQSVRGIALMRLIADLVEKQESEALKLYVPTRYCGEILGHRKELAPTYSRMGLGPGHIEVWDRDHFCLETPV